MCIFCKIVNGEIPSYKIYEDENTFAFLDIADDAIGHTLVVPKKHYENILDIESETLNNVMAVVKKISNHYVNNCGFDGINIINNNNECAEQSVLHLHFHIIPRKNNDGMKIFPKLDKVNCNFENVCESLTLMK